MIKSFITGKFIKDGVPIETGPSWGMSLKNAGSMRFRWNETNENRIDFIENLAGSDYKVAQVELIHSKIIYDVKNPSDVENSKGDGIITSNRKIIPMVTVADCMPIYIYSPETGVFGMLHSGWKGTGIVKDAILKASEVYGARSEDFCVVLGPHIHSCCYKIDESRVDYFTKNFTPNCVTDDMRLSLIEANLYVLETLGVRKSNILVSNECTCCNTMYGSFRRETSGLPVDMSLEERQKFFTVQCAWVKW